MSIRFDKATMSFQLDTQNTSTLFQVSKAGHLLGQYWGAKIHTDGLSRLWKTSPSGFTPFYPGAQDEPYSLDLLPSEYPFYGSGDYRSPAVQAEFADGSRILDLRYADHTVTKGDAAPIPGLPQLDGAGETLEIILKDLPTGLTVVLRYALYEAQDVIARSARIVNATEKRVVIHKALSASIDIPNESYEMISLYGSHLRERYIDRKPIRHGGQQVESRRGASSAQQNPFLALVSPQTTEQNGDAYAMTLIYSGNFVAGAEMDPFDTVRMQIGVNPFDFSWALEPGEVFYTPEAVLTYTDAGLNRMSQNFHDLFRRHLGKSRYRNRRRPIVINNWEATYFNFNEEKLLGIIDSCKGLGIDTFVLDDGWFGKRNNDTTSLGDWFVDKDKLPGGLTPLINRCREIGMSFGLWFEPEMISEQSELYKAHPDWCLKHDGRPYCLGRHQMILDLSRRDVLEYLKKAVGDILENNDISYVKWDMNRHMTDVFSKVLPADRQGEVFHRYMLNLYELLDSFTTRFPDVLFEGCSGGGGRFDAGLLYYMPQTWTSDDSDAIERLKIQYGTSLVYPPVSMTAHVSACPNHQVGRTTPFSTRGLVAMSASFGYELNPLSLSEEERCQIARQTAQYKKIADLVVDGDFYRLISPYTSEDCAWMFVSPDKKRAFAVFTRQRVLPAMPQKRLKLAGLKPDAKYRIEELDTELYGDELMNAGLALPMIRDYEAFSYTLTEC